MVAACRATLVRLDIMLISKAGNAEGGSRINGRQQQGSPDLVRKRAKLLAVVLPPSTEFSSERCRAFIGSLQPPGKQSDCSLREACRSNGSEQLGDRAAAG